ncbi:MAG TPA: O-antigen ligase family protein [Candidatus Polarisedimenticolia bacterium]|nr:O-antigen ligase family protein [Candidatus Polarisedimenticolia bacterium]
MKTETAASVTLLLAVAVSLLTPMRHAVLTRVSQIGDTHATTSRTRIELWRSGLRMFADHPVTGAGLDAFVAAFPAYRTPELTRLEWGGTPGKAHNDAIQILATQGLLGGLAALAILILTALALGRVARRGNPAARDTAIVTGASLAAYAVSSLVGFGTVAVSALAAALAGWASRAAWPVEAGSEPARPAWRLAAGILLAAVLGYFLVVRPLRAEIYLAEALHQPSGTPARGALLDSAARSAPWDPRFPAEVGRTYFAQALGEQDPSTRLELLALARRSLEGAIAVAPENGENRILYGTVLSGQSIMETGVSTPEQVRAEFLKAVALDPWSPMVLVGAERGLIASGLTADARALALTCARAYPEYAPPLADLGTMALEQGRTAAAAETLALAVTRDWREDQGSAAHAWTGLAQALLALGRNEEATAAADSALARDPRLGQAFAIKQAALRGMASGKK